MAGRTATAVTSVGRAALVAFPAPSVAGDAVNGNVSPNDGFTWLAILNGDAANTYTFSVVIASAIDTQTVGPRTYTIPISTAGTQLLGPFPVRYYGSQLQWNVSNANLKVALYSMLGP